MLGINIYNYYDTKPCHHTFSDPSLVLLVSSCNPETYMLHDKKSSESLVAMVIVIMFT